MALLVDSSLGLERLAREALLTLMGSLNEELSLMQADMVEEDRSLARERQMKYVPIVLEHVKPENFILGHRPSLIEAPIEDYPNVAVMMDTSIPAPVEQLDTVHLFLNQLVIEVMVKSEYSEEEVNRRAWRMAEAVNRVIQNNRTLNGLVHEITSPVNAQITSCLKRREAKGAGQEWFWQGARLEYEVIKITTL